VSALKHLSSSKSFMISCLTGMFTEPRWLFNLRTCARFALDLVIHLPRPRHARGGTFRPNFPSQPAKCPHLSNSKTWFTLASYAHTLRMSDRFRIRQAGLGHCSIALSWFARAYHTTYAVCIERNILKKSSACDLEHGFLKNTVVCVHGHFFVFHTLHKREAS
jgi:hypothetical protein